MNEIRGQHSLMGLAVVIGFAIAFIDGRLSSPGFPARWVIISCFIFGWLRPSRPWQWAAIIAGILVVVHGLRSTSLVDWYWTQVHSIPEIGRTYDLLGQPVPAVGTWWSKAVAFFPGFAATLLGRWCNQWSVTVRAAAVQQ